MKNNQQSNSHKTVQQVNAYLDYQQEGNTNINYFSKNILTKQSNID